MRVGTVKLFAGGYLPQGWLYCNGATYSKVEYPDLYRSIGTVFGGDGQPSFNVPNLSGRVPVSYGQGANTANIGFGEVGGEFTHTLSESEISAHNHQLLANDVKGDVKTPNESSQIARPATVMVEDIVETNGFIDSAPDLALQGATVGIVGSNQAHENMQPYLGMTYIIAFVNLDEEQVAQATKDSL